jgi:hypothetical protein
MLNTITPLSGWMLDLGVELDAHYPGFVGAYFRASNERRQVIAAFCASAKHSITSPSEVAAFLARSSHRTILKEAFGEVPHGMRGALARAGGQPHDGRFYSTLHRLLTEPRHARVVSAISQMPLLDFPRLRILNMLPEEVCTPGVVAALQDVETAKDAVKLIELLVANGVDRGALGQAISAVVDRQQLMRVTCSASQRVNSESTTFPVLSKCWIGFLTSVERRM